MDFGWHAFFKKPASSFHFRVSPFCNSFVIPPGGFSHGHKVIQHGPLTFGRKNNGTDAVSAAAQFSVNAWCTDSNVTTWKIKHSWNVVRIITCPQAHHLSDTFLLGNHLERVKSSNEFYYSKVFYILFTTVKAFYQLQIPIVTTAIIVVPSLVYINIYSFGVIICYNLVVGKMLQKIFFHCILEMQIRASWRYVLNFKSATHEPIWLKFGQLTVR